MLVGSGTFQNNPTSHIFLLAAHCHLHPSRVPGVEPRLPFEPHVHVAATGHGAILHPCPWRLSRSALVPHPQHTARSGEPWEVLPCGRKGCLRLHMGCSATCSRGRSPPALQGPKQRPLSLVAAALVGRLPILPSLNPWLRVPEALPCKDSCRRLVLLPGMPCVLCADPQPAQVECSVTASGRS